MLWIRSRLCLCRISVDLRYFDEHSNHKRNSTTLRQRDAFNFVAFIRISFARLKRGGYLYGQLDCWLIINRRHMIFCHYQKLFYYSSVVMLQTRWCCPQITGTLYFAVIQKRLWFENYEIYEVVAVDVLFIIIIQLSTLRLWRLRWNRKTWKYIREETRKHINASISQNNFLKF